MNSSWMFIVKLLILSGIISAAIKYLVPLVPLQATATVAWALVLIPPISLAIALWIRSRQFQQLNSTDSHSR